jgi:hypothetical protein
MSRLFEYTGLGAALVGAVSMVRGDWGGRAVGDGVGASLA